MNPDGTDNAVTGIWELGTPQKTEVFDFTPQPGGAFSGTRAFVTGAAAGPFAEAKELIAGYTLIQVKTREEGLEWAKRFPAPFGEDADGEIEVRPLYEIEDFGESQAIERFRELGTIGSNE